MIANIEEGIDDLTIHVKRITMFTLKLMSLTLQDNESTFFTNRDTNAPRHLQRQQPTYSRFFKIPEPTSDSGTTEILDNESKSSNTFFYNVVQNTRNFIRDSCNFHGSSILLRSQRVVNGLHEREQLRLHSSNHPLSAYTSHYADFCKSIGLSWSQSNSLYARYCSFHTTSNTDNEDDDDTSATVTKPDFSNILSHLPTYCDNGDVFCREKENDFIGFIKTFEQSGKIYSLSTPQCELEPEWKYIQRGGGCFVQIISEVVQIIRVLDIPFQFLAITLQGDAPTPLIATEGYHPFEGLSREDFKKVRYNPLDLTKGVGLKAGILKGDDRYIKSDVLKNLVWTYLVHLINDSAPTGKQLPSTFVVDPKELKRWNFKDDSMATLVHKAVVAMTFIYEDKVF